MYCGVFMPKVNLEKPFFLALHSGAKKVEEKRGLKLSFEVANKKFDESQHINFTY